MSGTVRWQDDHLVLLDQTRLPFDEVELHCTSVPIVAEAITTLRVRGAPAIGVAAAYGVALGAYITASGTVSAAQVARDVERACAQLAATRPTAVNLFWAIERQRCVLRRCLDCTPSALAAALLAEANCIAAEDEAACIAMGELGAPFIEDGASVLTHCNAGALATAGIGTATAPIFTAHRLGKHVHVFVDETRPLLQGARLTAWELKRAGVPFTLITDSMAASLMRRGSIRAVFVGADRIAANGDVANKIGTYGVALAACAHNIPFYVVAPTSTVDLNTAGGDAIAIEERAPEEVRSVRGCRIVPDDYPVLNPAFDVTPAAYVTAIITERAIVRAPYPSCLASLERPAEFARRTGSPVVDIRGSATALEESS